MEPKTELEHFNLLKEVLEAKQISLKSFFDTLGSYVFRQITLKELIKKLDTDVQKCLKNICLAKSEVSERVLRRLFDNPAPPRKAAAKEEEDSEEDEKKESEEESEPEEGDFPSEESNNDNDLSEGEDGEYGSRPSKKRKGTSWIPEENKKLTRLVREIKGKNRWKRIAVAMNNGKTANQLFQHYYRVINPNIKKGSWTLREEKILATYSSDFKASKIPWAKLASLLPGRTDIKVRYKYTAMITSMKIPWKKRDEDQLLQLVEKYGTDWDKIASKLVASKNGRRASRTAYECMVRYNKLNSK